MSSQETAKGLRGKEREPKRIVGRLYFFRHDKPVYSEDVAGLMNGYGYKATAYSSAQFEQQKMPEQLASPFHPSAERLDTFAARGRSVPLAEEKDGMERLRFEGTIVPAEKRENLPHLEEVLKEENVVPLIFVGSRTRHGLTAEAVVGELRGDGIDIPDKNIAVTDMLVELNRHWMEVFEASKELGYAQPWRAVLDPTPEHAQKLGEKGIETIDGITERTRHYLAVLDRLFRMKSAKDPSLSEKIPAVVNFASDLNQIALLRVLGVEAVHGKPLIEFRPTPGSYIEIEIHADDTATLFYQPVDASTREELAVVQGFHKEIEHAAPREDSGE